MQTRAPIELQIDFRDFRWSPKTPKEFLQFWDSFSRELAGRPLRAGGTHELEHPSDGVLRLTVISVPADESVVGQDTPFAIHSILEPPQYTRHCSRCSAEGKSSYGAYTCAACRDQRKPAQLCEEHIQILDGGMRLGIRLNATCDTHRPACRCGRLATFWCAGPRCRRETAWCENHRKQHPNASNIHYCLNCYEELFPACTSQRCAFTATGFCEYVLEGGAKCARRVCSQHIIRWQIYGPHKIGIGLCDQHRNLPRLTNEQILYQMVAATTNRMLAASRARQELPSLQSVRHCFIQVKRQAYEIPDINRMFVHLTQSVGRSDKHERAMHDLLLQHEPRRARDMKRDEEERSKGLQLFERLRQQLRVMGRGEVADAISFSDYRPTNNKLFVRLPLDLRKHMIGKDGKTIKQLKQIIGANIEFEVG